eukprot:365558-Chlamydomonas_euryale.AAC.15
MTPTSPPPELAELPPGSCAAALPAILTAARAAATYASTVFAVSDSRLMKSNSFLRARQRTRTRRRRRRSDQGAFPCSANS